MDFIITRTSQSFGGEKPLDNKKIFESTRQRWDIRTCKTEAEFDKKFGHTRQGKWRDKGAEHQTSDCGGIKRRLENKKCWRIKLDTLEEFLDFIGLLGEETVISIRESQGNDFEIEIYDTWRE
jgi:hypothetical protein